MNGRETNGSNAARAAAMPTYSAVVFAAHKAQPPGVAAMKALTPNTGKRRRIELEGESWYIIATVGPHGPAVDITCPRENAPENVRLRLIVETITAGINEIFTEIGGDHAT